MKLKLLHVVLTICSTTLFAQVQLTNGPELDNDRDNIMNRMLGGDDNNFYCYRIRSKGKGTSHFVEKYDKKTLNIIFSKNINIEDESKTKIEDVVYTSGNIYVFRSLNDKQAGKAMLLLQTITTDGKADEGLKEIAVVSPEELNFIDFAIHLNPSKTKFLVKSCYKTSTEDKYKTDFILFDAVSLRKKWIKTVNQKLAQDFTFFGTSMEFQGVGYAGLYLDDDDNFYYGFTTGVSNSKDETKYYLNLAIIKDEANSPKTVELRFDEDYKICDLKFIRNTNNEIVVGGYIKSQVNRKSADLIKIGIFSFKIDLANGNVSSKDIQIFDEKTLYNLGVTARHSKSINYQCDYILPIGDAIYYIGQQYRDNYVSPGNYGEAWVCEYMDVIVSKLNSHGQFEWTQNIPFRQSVRTAYKHLFKTYIAMGSSKNVYILGNEHPENMDIYLKKDYEPKDLQPVEGPRGCNFICSAVALTNGDIKRYLVLVNKDYCFVPIQERDPKLLPPKDADISVFSNNNEMFIYTENRGRDRFAKLKFE